MSPTKLIQRIVHPLSKEYITPCSRRFCLCIEYLNFSTKKDVQYYKNCMINNLKDDDRRHGLYSFEAYGTNLNFYSKNSL